MTDLKHSTILASAGKLLGTELADPVDLGGSLRSTVLRVSLAEGGTAIVKAYDTAVPEAPASFTAEAAGLAFGIGGPELLAADRESVLTVMSDLGSWPSLADVLLGDDPKAATAGLLDWARAYGGMARDSLDRGAELDTLLAHYGMGAESENHSAWLTERLPRFAELLRDLGLTVPASLDDEIAALGDLAHIGPRVFSPGDICPDNNLLTDSGFRVIDFEGAGYHSAYLDAAYVTMPFATCWCVYRLPADIAARVERTYWSKLTGGAPTEADRTGIRTAVAAWTLDMVTFLMRRCVDADRPMHRSRTPVASMREILRHRLATARDLLTAAGELPAVAEACTRLLDFSEPWETPRLELYPAFR